MSDTARTSLLAVGVKKKKTIRSIVIPKAAPTVTNCDHGETKSKALGSPSFMVNAKSGPNISVKTENTCIDRTSLGIAFTTNSPLACGENFLTDGLIEIMNVRTAPVHPITEIT